MRTSFDEPIQSPSPPENDGMKKCPFCAENIKAEAIKCRYCGEFLTGKPPAFRPKPGTKAWYQSTTTIVLALLTLGPLALPLVWIHPRYSMKTKVIVSIVVIVLTVVLCYAMVEMYVLLMKEVESLGGIT